MDTRAHQCDDDRVGTGSLMGTASMILSSYINKKWQQDPFVTFRVLCLKQTWFCEPPLTPTAGFCDGDPTNDLTLANGTTVGESEDPAIFIDSWQVPNTTSYISHSRRRELNCSTSDCSTCLAMLQSPAFSSCHAFVR